MNKSSNTLFSDPYARAVFILCAVLFCLILFILLGGARALYAISSPPSSPEVEIQVEDLAQSAEIIPESAPELYTNGILLSPISGSEDLRDAVYMRKLYSAWTKDGTSHMQGACTDGTTIWVGWSEPYVLMKIHIITRKVELYRYSDSDWPFGHINDMTYNPNTNRLYIVSYFSDVPSTYGNLAVVDPETFEVEKMLTLRKDKKAYSFHGIAYDRLHNQYILTSAGDQYDFWDADFNYLKSVSVTRYESDTLQGIETDGSYIYRGLWRNFEKNTIAVYDYNGNSLRLIDVPISGDETEFQDIMYDWNGNWYINTADYDAEKNLAGCSFYYIGMQDAVNYEHVEQFQAMLEDFLLKGTE